MPLFRYAEYMVTIYYYADTPAAALLPFHFRRHAAMLR